MLGQTTLWDRETTSATYFTKERYCQKEDDQGSLFRYTQVCFNSLAEVWPLGLPKAKSLWQTSFAMVCSNTGSKAPNPRVPKMATPNACAGQAPGKFAYTQGLKVLCTKFRCACKLMESVGVDIAKRSQVLLFCHLSAPKTLIRRDQRSRPKPITLLCPSKEMRLARVSRLCDTWSRRT